MSGIRVEGFSGVEVEVSAARNLNVALPSGVVPADVGAIRMLSENDAGTIVGVAQLKAMETDVDSRLRTSMDHLLDVEVFNYVAQNTGKHSFLNTTMTASFSAAGFTTNAANVNTVTTGLTLSTYAEFPIYGSTEFYCEMALAFTQQPVSNTIIDFGPFRRGAANPYAPTDGAFFRLTSAGLIGVVNSNGTETLTAPFDFAYVNAEVHSYIVTCHERLTRFWIDGILYGQTVTPQAQARPFQSASLPISIRHAITGGAAGGVINAIMRGYVVSAGGTGYSSIPSTSGNRMHGAYQGLSGGVMGSLATYPNSTAPVAAVPTNTALTANLPSGLGGQGAVTAQAAAATDLIFASAQVPVGSALVQGRRLVIRGVQVDAVNLGAVVATSATTIQFSLALGHTAVSLATAEGAASKTPRRIPIGFATWLIGAPIGDGPKAGRLTLDLGDAPAYVNPGEFVALVGKFVSGTATASQVVQFTYTLIYGWE